MPRQKLTNRFVNGLKPTGKRIDYSDTELPGFQLRLEASGAKVYRYIYREGKGRGAQRRVEKLGLALELPVDKARQLAMEIAARVRAGESPAKERAKRKAELTVAELWPEFLQGHLRAKGRAPRTIEEYQRDFDNRIRPAFGDVKLSDLSRADVERWVRAAHKHPRRANHALSVLSSMLSFAIKTGEMAGPNPCALVDKYPEKTRDVLYTNDEIARYLKALEDEPDPALRAMLKVIIGTGCRSAEARLAEWSEFRLDGDAPSWTVPAEKMKQRKPHTYVLCSSLAAMLRRYRREAPLVSPRWAFPGPSGRAPRNEIRHVHARIEERAGLEKVEGRGLHAFRRSLLTELARNGASAPQLQAWAGHASIQTAMKYVKLGSEDPVNRAFAEGRGIEFG
ncbi:tyrosine-type recombinase/integrase [Rhodovulum sp. DZ06]|uniref:tyrosine-type recombinase/integrase n=1 Tax=Rhodovulum sp. DZ06 TaxID=3425126 RepID=UPI003D33798D